ncbi:hypothetical protein C8J57DRAFT_1458534 [Mycena rebaudengoi]|nr:hypothetical protein C8J57DRAFT_1458534 [Mycena rebaudengoi]
MRTVVLLACLLAVPGGDENNRLVAKASVPVKSSKKPVPVQQSKTAVPVKSTASTAPSKSVVRSSSPASVPVPLSVKSVFSSASSQVTSRSSLPSSAPAISSSASAISSTQASTSRSVSAPGSLASSSTLAVSVRSSGGVLPSSILASAASASGSASGPSGSSASATVSSQSASASSSALPAPPPCSANCLAPTSDMVTPDLLADLDIDGAVVVASNGTSVIGPPSLSKRANREVTLCGSTVTSAANGATAFRNGITAATPAKAYTFTNPGGQDFTISESSVATAQAAPFIIEHVFEFQIMGHFLEANNALCQQQAVTSAFQDIVNLIDNPSNMVYAHTVINQVKLQVVANNQFGVSSLETGFIAAGAFSGQLNDLTAQTAVDARTKAQLILRSTGGLINYLNDVGPVFKDTATRIQARLETALAGTGKTFAEWLEGEVGSYQGRVTFWGVLMAKNYQFQAVGRPNALAMNNFNPGQMVNDIAAVNFPRLNAGAMTLPI